MNESVEPLGLRERKRRRTEAAIRTAALTLVSQRGFDQVTTDDIASEVEISKTTFYRYFDSKEDALLGRLAENHDRMREALDARPTDEPALTAVRHAVMDFIDGFEHDREASLLKGRLLRETPSLAARNLEHQAAWESLIAEFVLPRLPDAPDNAMRARIVAAIVVATVRATVDYWRDTDGVEQLSDLMSDALAMLAERRPALTHP